MDPDRVTSFLELGQNPQIWMKMDKNLIFCEVFQTRNPVNILSRSAIVSYGDGSFKEPDTQTVLLEMSCEISG